MLVRERPVVIAVCGCPGAGKTTIASATAGRFGIPFLTRDEIKTGLGLSSASVAEDGRVRLDRDFQARFVRCLLAASGRTMIAGNAGRSYEPTARRPTNSSPWGS
ncbi:hypothetical protein [Micromonospora purpureochromogenes]|uniref:hypothetical protein n=1 Tax=Micromonospora purpureochromogenes TaxID=47872 RepID=UPI00358DA738